MIQWLLQQSCPLMTLFQIKSMFTYVSNLEIKVQVEVFDLVSGAKWYSPDYTQLPPGHRTCSFIGLCHLNSPGSTQPWCHHGAGNCSNTRKPSLPYQVLTWS